MKQAFLASIAGLLVLLAAAAWLLATNSGLNWLANRYSTVLQFEMIEGSVTGPIRFRGVQLSTSSLQINVMEGELQWQPLQLFSGVLVVDDLQMTGMKASNAGGQQGSAENSALPFALALNNVNIANARWNDIQIDQLTASAHLADNDLEITKLNLQVPNHELTINGALDITMAADGEVNLQQTISSKLNDSQSLLGEGSVKGTWASLELIHQTEVPFSSSINATLSDLTGDDRSWVAEINLLGASVPAAANLSTDAKFHGNISSRGSMAAQEIDANLQLQRDKQWLGLSLDAEVEAERLTIAKCVVSRIADADGSSAQPSLELEGVINRYDQLFTSTTSSAGAKTDADINIQALWFDSELQNLFFQSKLTSPKGRMSVNGKLDRFQFELDAEVKSTFFENNRQFKTLQQQGRLNAIGNGSLQQLTVENLSLNSVFGNIDGSGRLSWTDGIAWRSDVAMKNLKPEAWIASWPGELGGQLSTEGQQTEQGLESSVIIKRFAGTLKQQAVTVDGRILLKSGNADIERLSATFGEADLQVDGLISDTGNSTLNFKFSAQDLHDLNNGLRGSLSSSGTLRGRLSEPDIVVIGNGNNLGFGEWSAEHVELDIKLPISSPTRPWNATAKFVQMGLNNRAVIQRGNLLLQGNASAHTISIESSLASGVEQVASISAGWADRLWSGMLDSMTFNRAGQNNWQLQKPAAFAISSNTQSIAELCLSNGSDPAKGIGCITINNGNRGLHTKLKFEQVPSAPFNYLLEKTGLQLDTFLDADIAVNIRDNQWNRPKITGFLRSTGGSLAYSPPDGGADRSINFGNLESSFDTLNKTHASISVELENGGFIRGQASATESPFTENFANSNLTGTLDTRIPDISKVLLLNTGDLELSGALLAHITLAGSATQPTLGADIKVTEGALIHDALGLKLSDLSLRVDSGESSRAKLVGSARSGAGFYELNGTLNLADISNVSGELDLSGNNVSFVNSSTISADGGLALTVTVNANQIDVDGDLNIERADVRFGKQLGVVNESDDVYLVGQQTRSSSLLRSLQIRVNFGDDTQLNVLGLRGRLVGSPSIKVDPNGTVTSIGEINIRDGRYAAYGQKLEIAKGQAVYAGGAIDNPDLHIEATRAVNNSTVGILIKGRAEQPEISLFSNPAMNDQDILSVLVFSKPTAELSSSDGIRLLAIANSLRGGTSSSKIDEMSDGIAGFFGLENFKVEADVSNNQPSIGLTSQINSKLSVGYGYNFYSSIRTMFLRYRISDAWSIQSNIDEESGADFKYQLETN